MTQLEIAQTIQYQIRCTDPFALMAWGAQKLKALREEKLSCGNYQLGGLEFKVNGMKFKGLVTVRLIANDTYTVELGKVKKGSYEIIKTIQGVYCDKLMRVIDSEIERD